MTNCTPSIIAMAVALCFAAPTQAVEADNPDHQLGKVEINGVEKTYEQNDEFWKNVQIGTLADDVKITASGTYTWSDGKGKVYTSYNRPLWLNGTDKGDIKGRNITVIAAGRGVQSAYGSTLNMTAEDTLAITGKEIGVVAIKEAKLNLKAKNIVINSDSIGLIAQNNTELDQAPEGATTVNLEGENIAVNAPTGIANFSNSQTNVNGNLTVTSEEAALDVRGNSTLNINKSGKFKTVLNGDIVFETPNSPSDSQNSGKLINAIVDVNFNGAGSVFNGSAYQQYKVNGQAVNNVELNADPYHGNVTGFTMTFANGAVWNMEGDSFINNLHLNEGGSVVMQKDAAVFNADVFDMNGGTLDVQNAEAKVTVNTVQGSGADISLAAVTEDGATLSKAAEVKIVKGASADTKLNVTASGITADDVKDADKMLEALNSQIKIDEKAGVKKGFTTTATYEEGNVKGSISQSFDETGKATGDVVEHVNRKLEGYSALDVLTGLIWRHDMNDLTKRMGELRMSPAGIGTWARIYGSEYEYCVQNVNSDMNTIQVGADTRIGDWVVGGAFSYTDGQATFDMGNADSKLYGLAAYGSWMNTDGQFVDLIAKYSRISNDFTSGTMSGSYDQNALSVSAEYGWHLKLSDVAFVEPQAELTYGRIFGDDFTASNGVKVEQEDFESFVGRLGTRAGFYFPNNRGTVYTRVSVAYDFMGETESRASQDGNFETLKDDLGGTWVEYAVGANFNLTDTVYTYVDLEKTSGGDVRENYRWNLGVRAVW